LTRCYGSMREYEVKLKAQQEKLNSQIRLVWILIGILLLRTVAMVVGFILYIKGIQLPRWLDIFL
jgi:hypothetical protein